MKYAVLVASCVLFLGVGSVLAESYEIPWQVVSGGGTNAGSTNYHLAGTVGQTAVGVVTSTSYDLEQGFWVGRTPSEACCVGTVGNTNGDPGDVVDVSDLTMLINHLFLTFEPLDCMAEGNMSGDASCLVDVSDLTALVNHLFLTFDPMPACMPECE